MAKKKVGKKSGGKKKVYQCEKSFGRSRGRCLGTPQYFCNKEKKYFCYDCSHMQDTLKYCCHYKFLSSSGMSFSEKEEFGEEREKISDCDHKKCKSREANYWCERRQKWLCTDHFHTSGTCCNYFGGGQDYQDTGRGSGKPKEVKFANS